MFSKIKLFSKKDKPADIGPALTFFEKARKDWKILLLAAIAIGIIVIALDVYLLWRVNTGDIFTTEATAETDTTTTDKQILTNVVKFFDDRAAHYATFQSTPKTEIDPSL